MRCCARIALIAGALAGPAHAEGPATPAFLPTPYSAEQIRDAWQPGFRVEMRTTAGDDRSDERLTVVNATPEGCTIRRELFDSAGGVREAPGEFTARWAELRDHALFEAATTTRERAECRSGLGVMPGWLYLIARPDNETRSTCFADAAPGPPVEWERLRAGELISRTEHTQYGRPSRPEEKP